jgi:hypothetical protein
MVNGGNRNVKIHIRRITVDADADCFRHGVADIVAGPALEKTLVIFGHLGETDGSVG